MLKVISKLNNVKDPNQTKFGKTDRLYTCSHGAKNSVSEGDIIFLSVTDIYKYRMEKSKTVCKFFKGPGGCSDSDCGYLHPRTSKSKELGPRSKTFSKKRVAGK